MGYNPETGEWENETVSLEGERENYFEKEAPRALDQINIKGYGQKIAAESYPGGGAYTNEWGEPVSPEYIKDIDDTIDKYGFDIPESKLRESGVPLKPTDEKLSLFERWQDYHSKIKPMIESEATARAEDAKSAVNRAYYGMLPNSDIALIKPEKHAEISQKAAQAYNSTFQHVFDKEEQAYRSVFEKEEALKERRIDAEKKRQEQIADRLAKDEARLDDRTKTYLQTLRTEQADIGKELRGVKAQLVKFGVANPDVVPPTLAKNEMISGLVNQYQQSKESNLALDEKIRNIILNKSSEAKAIEEKGVEAPKEKTVTINGKQYRDGDEVVVNGKRKRVRIK